jgi:L-histidine N-alpha-methyltransferase
MQPARGLGFRFFESRKGLALSLEEMDAGRKLVDGFQNAIDGDRHVLIRTAWKSEPVLEFAASVASGLGQRPRRLDYRFLYDSRGSELFELITEQPEYYPTRTENSILARCARQVRETTGPVTLLELGSGSSVKTNHLIAAYLDRDDEQFYVPVDVSESALKQATNDLDDHHDGVRVVSVHGTYDMATKLFECASPMMAIFLGSSIGNFQADEENAFWERVADAMMTGDWFLLGVDLVKDKRIIDAAYNDDSGITEEFIKNLFVRMNRELGAALDVSAIKHEARYVAERERVDVHARFTEPQTVRVEPLGKRFRLGEGERVLVEISRKFHIERLRPYLESRGFRTRRVFTDDEGWFAVLLLQRA